MILYTTMPLELIYQETNETFETQSLIEVNGLSLVVEPVSNGQCRIVQVLSTNPNDFLNANYSPGSILSLKPQF